MKHSQESGSARRPFRVNQGFRRVVELYYYPSYISLLPRILLHEIGIEHRLILVDRYASGPVRCDHAL